MHVIEGPPPDMSACSLDLIPEEKTPLFIYPLHVTYYILKCSEGTARVQGCSAAETEDGTLQSCPASRVVVLKCKRPPERLSSLPHWRL